MEIPTMMVGVRMAGCSAGRLEERLRRLDLPIIVRVAENELLLDLRTVAEDELALIRNGFLFLAENT
jgi:L-seryl-tRNA(Ser) seleniumtransferase